MVYPEFMRTYFLIAMVCLCFTASAGIYKWVDENGKVHYSDQEQSGSEEVKLPATITYTPTAAAGETSHKDPTIAHSYTEMTIVQPKMNETLHSNTGDVQVSIKLAPRLQSGDTITIYLDGNEILKGKTQMAFTLVNIDRGSHTLRATVFDRNGVSLISSSSVIFHLKRAIAKSTDGSKPTDNSQAYTPDFNQDESKKADYKKDLSNDFNKDYSKDYDSSNSYKDGAKKFNDGIPANSGTYKPGTGTYAPNFNQKK